MSKRLACLFVLCAIILFCGCERRPLVDYSNSVTLKVKVRTDNILNITPGTHYPGSENIPRPVIDTEIYQVNFYDINTGELAFYNYISQEEIADDGNKVIYGTIKVRPGVYDVLCYNFDLQSTLIKNMNSWGDITAYTSEISEYLYSRFQSRADNSDAIYYQPDHVLVARLDDLEIKEYVKEEVVELDANTVNDTYYVQVRLKNGKYASNATAVLSGLAVTNQLGPNICGTVPGATFFEMYKSVDTRLRSVNQNVLCGVFNTFGKIDEADSRMTITFNVVTTKGDIQEMVVDAEEMKKVFASEEAINNHWLLIDKEFEIVPPESEQGGFRPTVSDWEEDRGVIEF